MASQNKIQTAENNEKLKVMVHLPDEIRFGQPCEVKVDIRNVSPSKVLVNKRLAVGYPNSLARELYILILKQDSTINAGVQKVLYTRDFSPSSDYVWLLPQEQISTLFNMFNWYEIPEPGNYTIQVCYQADEKLAYKPDGLCEGTFCSREKIVTLKSE